MLSGGRIDDRRNPFLSRTTVTSEQSNRRWGTGPGTLINSDPLGASSVPIFDGTEATLALTSTITASGVTK